MKIDCAYDELVELSKLVPNPKNNNKHPKEQIAFEYIVNHAREYVKKLGGFEKLAEWGLR